LGIVSFSPWNLQQINSPAGQKAGVTDGPATVGDPVASVSGSRQHIGYVDAVGSIHDCWYDGSRGRWNRQQINGAGGVTSGPPAVGDPFIWAPAPGQQHVTYQVAGGVIYDSWYAAGRWNLRQINGPGGVTSGPPAAGDPFVSVFGDQQHIGYLDVAGMVQDCWYADGSWNLQQVNGDGGRTRASAAAGGPYIWTVRSEQQHFTYYDTAGTIHDSWFAAGRWNLQHLNGAGGLTDGPATAGRPVVSVYGDQQHCLYLGRSPNDEGIIHDAWFDGAKNRWNLQQINGDGGLTTGPAAAGAPCASVFGPQLPSARSGQHVAYRDSAGTVHDSWFGSLTSSWNLQRVIGAGSATDGPAASGGPCVWTAGSSQQHFTYRTADGAIYDAWFNGAAIHP
jgi:hypothetical protein